MKLRKFTAPGCWQMEGVWQYRDRDRTRISHQPLHQLMGAIIPHTLTSVQSLTAPTVAVSDANFPKAGGTINLQVFDKHRSTGRNGKFLLIYQDATNHATIEKLGGKLQK